MNHSEIRAQALENVDTKAAFDGMKAEFDLLRQMLAARQRNGLNQAEVAQKMGTHAPSITRLESSLGNGRHSPSISTLQKYAKAVGCTLEINLVQNP